MAHYQALGRPPFINVIVGTDYGPHLKDMAANGPETTLTLHLEIPLEAGEVTAITGYLQKKDFEEAHKIAQTAMARLVPAGEKKGDDCRALVRAAFRMKSAAQEK